MGNWVENLPSFIDFHRRLPRAFAMAKYIGRVIARTRTRTAVPTAICSRICLTLTTRFLADD